MSSTNVALPPPPPRSSALRVWVRRAVFVAEPGAAGWSEAPRADGPSAYAVRYVAEEGRALLRIARPGVLIDPPPRATGEEDGLSIGQLRESRLLHAEEATRARRAWSFGRLDPVALAALPAGEWIELRGELVHGQGWLLLSERRRETGGFEEPTSPKRMLDTFREEMAAGDERAAHAEAAPSLAPEPTHGIARGRRWSQDEPTEIPSAYFDDEAPTQRAPRPEATPPVGPPPPEPVPFEPPAFEPAAFEPPPPPLPPPAPVQAPAAAPAPEVHFHERNTTLVRHLRRRVQASEQRIRELEAILKVTNPGSTGGGR